MLDEPEDNFLIVLAVIENGVDVQDSIAIFNPVARADRCCYRVVWQFLDRSQHWLYSHCRLKLSTAGNSRA